ncbi:MAG: AI-2E family transporter [Chloroflexi bacterium]|nr:AI-2E family transporter [Chloroflexota bacterium]
MLLVYLLFVLIVFVGVMWLIVSLAETAVAALQGLQTAVNSLIPSPDNFTIGSFDLGFILEPLRKLATIGSGISLLTSSGVIDIFFQAFSVLASSLSNVFFIVIVMLFFLLEKPRTITTFGNQLSAESRREYAILLTRLANLFQNYLVGSLLVVLFYWALATVQLWITGVPNAFTYGFIIGLPNFVPNVGGYFSIILIFFITLFAGSDTISMNPLLFAFLEMAVFMLLAGIAYYFINVRIYSRSVNIPVWLLLFGIVAFGAAFGLLGIIVAAAAIAMVGELLQFMLKKNSRQGPLSRHSRDGAVYGEPGIIGSGKAAEREKVADVSWFGGDEFACF